jgi:hypothetical protein
LEQRSRRGAEPLYRAVEPGVRFRSLIRGLGHHAQRVRHQRAHELGLLQEIPRHHLVDQDRRAHHQHHHVGAQLVEGGVAVAFPRALSHSLGYRTRRALGLGHDDGRLRGHGACPVVDLPEPDHLVDHQQCDQQHEQPRHRVAGQRVTVPPPAHRPVVDVQDHQHAGEQRDDQRREPTLPP